MTITKAQSGDDAGIAPSPVRHDVVNEDGALALLQSSDLSAEEVEEISENSAVMSSRKVRLAMAAHARTPRRIALRLVRELYTFDLVQFSQMPTAPPDLKRAADELIVKRLSSITLGERISLARRSSAQVVAALLADKEPSVWQAALENPRLTEVAVIRALQRGATAALVEAVCHHAKWSLRADVRIALLRNTHTPLARAIEFARRMPPAQLRDILHASRLPEQVKTYLRKELDTRT